MAILDGEVKGLPLVLYKDTQANIEALGSPVEGMVAYATDVNQFGYYEDASWTWLDDDHGGLDGLTDDDHTQYLLAAGTRALSADWDAGSFEVRAQTLESDVATGTAPLTVASTTKVTNLNADQVDGADASATSTANQIPIVNGSSNLVLPGDVYPNDDAGLLVRADRTYVTSLSSGAIDDHFSDATVPAWGTWAIGAGPTGAGSENSEADSLWHVNPSDADVNVREFYYKTMTGSSSTSAQIRSIVEHQANVGLRLDDGTMNNYVEVWIETATVSTVNIASRYVVGGGGETAVNHISGVEKGFFRIISLYASGTFGSNWSARLDHGVDQLAYIAVFASGLTWTPTRVGLVFLKTATSTARGSYTDWYRTGFS